MRTKNRLYTITVGCILLLSLIAGVLLYFAQTTGYDSTIEHFAKGSPHATATAVLIAILSLGGIAVSFFRPKEGPLSDFSGPGPFTAFTGALLGFLLLVSFIMEIGALSEGLPLLTVIRFVSMALAAIYFFLTALTEGKGGGYALASLCPMLFAMLSVLVAYFERGFGLNSPVKTYTILAYVAMALFFSSESRFALGRGALFWHTAFSVLCIAFALPVGLSRFVLALSGNPLGMSPLESAICMLVAFYALSRLLPCKSKAKEAKE